MKIDLNFRSEPKSECCDCDDIKVNKDAQEKEEINRRLGVVDVPVLKFSHFRRGGGVHAVTVIRPHLMLCGATAIQLTTLHDLRVTCVVHATKELPDTPLPSNQIFYLRLPVPDDPDADLFQYMDVVADLIHQVGESGGRTLVHCLAGVSRSSALCLAYLVKHEGLSLTDAYRELRVLRPIVRPNSGFLKQLRKFEELLNSGKSNHDRNHFSYSTKKS